jgi:hypothetical protein
MPSSLPIHPQVLWAQREDLLYVTVEGWDMKNERLSWTDASLLLVADSAAEGTQDKYNVQLDFYAPVNFEVSSLFHNLNQCILSLYILFLSIAFLIYTTFSVVFLFYASFFALTLSPPFHLYLLLSMPFPFSIRFYPFVFLPVITNMPCLHSLTDRWFRRQNMSELPVTLSS